MPTDVAGAAAQSGGGQPLAGAGAAETLGDALLLPTRNDGSDRARQLNGWGGRAESLVRNWGSVAKAYAWMYQEGRAQLDAAGGRCRMATYVVNGLVAVVQVIIGVVGFSYSGSYDSAWARASAIIITAVLAQASSLLTLYAAESQFDRNAARYENAAKAWTEYARDADATLALPPHDRRVCRDYVEIARRAMDVNSHAFDIPPKELRARADAVMGVDGPAANRDIGSGCRHQEEFTISVNTSTPESAVTSSSRARRFYGHGRRDKQGNRSRSQLRRQAWIRNRRAHDQRTSNDFFDDGHSAYSSRIEEESDGSRDEDDEEEDDENGYGGHERHAHTLRAHGAKQDKTQTVPPTATLRVPQTTHVQATQQGTQNMPQLAAQTDHRSIAEQRYAVNGDHDSIV